MWTNGGCRGAFECDGVKNVQCNVDGGSKKTCRCVAGAPPAPPLPPNAKKNCTGALTDVQKIVLLNKEVSGARVLDQVWVVLCLVAHAKKPTW